MSATRRVVAIVDDLMLESRISTAAPDDIALVFPRDAKTFKEQLDPPPDLIVVSMTATRLPWVELIHATRAHPLSRDVPILAFGPHMDLELRHGALEAGANRVLANSAFMMALPRLLRGGEEPDRPTTG